MRELQIKLHIRLGDWKKSPRTFVQVCTGGHFYMRSIYYIFTWINFVEQFWPRLSYG